MDSSTGVLEWRLSTRFRVKGEEEAYVSVVVLDLSGAVDDDGWGAGGGVE